MSLSTHFGDRRNALLPEDNGSGLAFGDFDNDGFDDLYVANLAGSVLLPREELVETRPGGKLFRNLGNGRFEETTAKSGLAHVGWDNAAIWADIDGDGWLDLVISGLDEITLFRNRGDGTFEDWSDEANLGAFECIGGGPAAADYDRDGDLDLYVPCYVDFPWERVDTRQIVGGRPATMTTPANYPPQQDLFFRNEGDGRFVEIAAEAGTIDPSGRGLQAVFVDLDDDGWQDLYVANDQSFDRLYRNLGDGTFEEAGRTAGTRDPRAGMGVAIGDYNDDQRIDLFLTHWVGEENALYRNESRDGVLLFGDETVEEGLAPADPALVGWGTGLFDFDLDGDLDLLVVNGSTVEDEWTLEVLSDPKMIPQKMALYERDGSRFEDVSERSGAIFGENLVGRGATFADYDRDGLVDVAVLVHNGPVRLLANRSAPRGGWLGVQLEATGGNRFGVGSRVTVTCGEHRRVRQLLAGESYAGSNSMTLHVGLGDCGEEPRVDVRWPDGSVTDIGSVASDRVVRIRRESGDWVEVPIESVEPRPWGEL